MVYFGGDLRAGKGNMMELIIDSVSKQYGPGTWGVREFSLHLIAENGRGRTP
jgi:hypothetical protein